MERREFLQSTGVGIASVLGVGAASASEDGDGPIRVEGVRIHRFTPTGKDTFDYEEQFRSGRLRAKFGTETVTVDEATVTREQLPEEYRDRKGRFQITRPDTAVLGHMSEFVARESGASGDVGTQTHDLPEYCYKNADAAERTGPINVAWEVNESASEIRSAMRDNVSWWDGECWCSDLPSFDRYAVIDGSETKNDSGVAKSVGSHLTGSQWHARLWNMPDGRVVAQAHYDVQDHGTILLDPDYRFEESRRTVADTWTDALDYSENVYYQGNGSGYTCDDSSNGYVSKII
jgi:hypothetical protein